jgi:2'-5' RNA ligase
MGVKINMRSMALKINVSKNDQTALNNLLVESGYKPQNRKFHCTLGFIDKMIPEEELTSFGDAIVREMQKEVSRIRPLYEVDAAQFLFGHIIAFTPSVVKSRTLNEMHRWLSGKVAELSEERWAIDEKYVPHMTLWRTRHLDSRFEKLKLLALRHPSYYLTEADFVPL